MVFVSCRPQVSPHMMIMWRPDAGSYNAYLLKEAPTNATVDTNPAIEMSLSPSTKGEALQDRCSAWHFVALLRVNASLSLVYSTLFCCANAVLLAAPSLAPFHSSRLADRQLMASCCATVHGTLHTLTTQALQAVQQCVK
jgi:hypothetical protein